MLDDIMGRVVAHFRPAELRRVDVAEWGSDGVPLTVWFSPVTLDDLDRMNRRGAADRQTEFARYAWLVIEKACDAAGARLFPEGNREQWRATLMTQADPYVITRLALAMLSGGTEAGAK